MATLFWTWWQGCSGMVETLVWNMQSAHEGLLLRIFSIPEKVTQGRFLIQPV